MDSVLYTTLMVAGFFAVTTVGPVVAYKIKQAQKKKEVYKELKKHKKLKEDPEYQEKYIKQHNLNAELEKATTLEFKNKKLGVKCNQVVENTTAVTKIESMVDEDLVGSLLDQVVVRGEMACQGPDGVVRLEPIYLLQPLYQTPSKEVVGPFLTKSGHLKEEPYVIQTKDQGIQLTASLPKVEAISKVSFDYVKGSASCDNESLRTILSVSVPRDKYGNIIPVNFNDKKELEEFRKYVVRFVGKTFKEAQIYYCSIIEAAKSTAEERQQLKIEPYNVDYLFEDEKVEEKTQQPQIIIQQSDLGFGSYYDRFNPTPGPLDRVADYRDIGDHITDAITGQESPGFEPGYGGGRRSHR